MKVKIIAECNTFDLHWATRGVQYVVKTAQNILKFYIYRLHNYFH